MPEQEKMINAAVIVAAGRGHRAGTSLPKQYLELNGKTVLRRTIESFLAHQDISLVQVVIHPDDLELYDKAVEGLELPPPVSGGESRQASVLNGLEALAPRKPTNVLIHDAARPFVSRHDISNILTKLENHPAVLPAVRLADTLKREKNGMVGDTLDREGLWRAQTPQGFEFASILEAHRRQAGQNLTDDCAVAEASDIAVAIVESSENNFKITTADDVKRAQQMTATQILTRMGSGFDVHGFCDGDQVTLCGISIPHNRSLKGHSDADVALHALTDALLGSMALGDIGQHFPPGDSDWKNADSAIFLQKANDLVRQAGAEVVNLDLTIICESPKIGPHSEAMRKNVATLLDLPIDRVSIKATTTEGLGFAGRKEGIAAQALASVRCPE